MFVCLTSGNDSYVIGSYTCSKQNIKGFVLLMHCLLAACGLLVYFVLEIWPCCASLQR